MWHDMATIILCFWSPYPKHQHDLHRHRHDTLIFIIASWSSRQLLLLQLSLTHSDKVKQLHGACTSYNKETTLRLLPVVDITKHDHLIHKTYITSYLDHITSQHALQKQVRHPLLCWCKFYVAATGWARTVLTYASKAQRFFVKCVVLTFNKDRA